MKIALAHDYLIQSGGAERVLEAFSEIWPEAPIYTLIYDRRLFCPAGNNFLDNRQVKTSFLQKIPFSHSHHRLFSLLMPLAAEQLDFSGFDVVLSDSASFAKGIITRPRTFHVCYCHTPLRYAWDDCHRYFKEFGLAGPVKLLAPAMISYLRLWDRAAANRPDRFIANSDFVRRRIRKYYQRDAEVIHPPVGEGFFGCGRSGAREDYFLMVGRFLPYKKFDIAIEAFNGMDRRLKIVGSGPDEKRLRSLAGPNIDFLGRLSEADLAGYYQRARAFVFPQEEDFGITAVEAMASGLPVIAYRAGGALETVVEGETGVFFAEQTPRALAEAVIRSEGIAFDRARISGHAGNFGKGNFKEKIKNFVERSYDEWQKNHDYRR